MSPKLVFESARSGDAAESEVLGVGMILFVELILAIDSMYTA